MTKFPFDWLNPKNLNQSKLRQPAKDQVHVREAS